MSQIQTVVRGNYVLFSAQFLQPSGSPASPDSAELFVYFFIDGESAEDSVVMTPTADSSIWTAIWNTAGIDPPVVSWSVKALAAGLTLVQDGSFAVTANNANQQGSHP